MSAEPKASPAGHRPDDAGAAEPERFMIKLDNGQWYKGRAGDGSYEWTRVPAWAQAITSPAELAELLEWLEQSEHDYTLLQGR